MGLLFHKSHHSETGQGAAAVAHEEKLRKLGLFSLENRQFGGEQSSSPLAPMRRGLRKGSQALHGGRRRDNR